MQEDFLVGDVDTSRISGRPVPRDLKWHRTRHWRELIAPFFLKSFFFLSFWPTVFWPVQKSIFSIVLLMRTAALLCNNIMCVLMIVEGCSALAH
eukprot:COSAG01_NODE_1439_length_10302_cov_21.631775_2_plen_94_part_00